MTRNLRKRHLIMWIIISVVVTLLLYSARVNVPQFKGDQSNQIVN